jgi:hypothetical protein
VKIVAGRKKTVGPNYLAGLMIPIGLRFLHALDKHCAVHGKEEACRSDRNRTGLY